MHTYKAGDRVRVLEDRAFAAGVRRGDLGTVVQICGNGNLKVKMDDGEARGIGRDFDWYLRPTDVAPVEDEPAPAYKAGDRVRVLEDDAHGAEVKRGDLGTVTGVDSDGDLRVKMDDGPGFDEFDWYLRPSHVEPVEDEPAADAETVSIAKVEALLLALGAPAVDVRTFVEVLKVAAS